MNFYQNKSQTVALLTFIVAGIIIALFFAGFIYMFNSATSILQTIPSTTQVNVSYAVNSIIVPVNNNMYMLNMISVAILIGLILGMFVEAYFVRKHPILFVVHFFIVALAITGSIYISNYYESIMSNDILGTLITNNTGMNFIQLNLPIITTIVGFIGFILMFIRLNKDSYDSRGSL